jgi:O-antigen ligase
VADGFNNTAAHNEYIQLAAETGYPGLLFYLAGLISLFAANLKAVRSAYKSGGRLSPYSVIAAGSALSYLISAFFGVSLSYTASFFFVLLGLGVISIKKENMS